MEFINTLFQAKLLLFSLPVTISLIIWLFSFLGLFHFHADLNHEPHLELDGHAHFADSFLEMLGVGKVPLSLVMTVIMFTFGWSGLAGYFIIEKVFPVAVLNFILTIPLLAIFSLFFSFLFTALLAKPLKKIFQDYGEATKSEDLIGKIAIITTNSVSKDFGSATVKLDSGVSVEVDIRSPQENSELNYGAEVLLVGFDSKDNYYLIEALENKIKLVDNEENLNDSVKNKDYRKKKEKENG